MISITCTNCRSTLTIDDAFAGGVCRCQFCGTIQTVPSKSEVSAVHAAAPPRALYQRQSPARPAPPSRNRVIDDLAEAVAGSGLSGSGLAGTREPRLSPPPDSDAPAPEPARVRTGVILIFAATAIVFGGIIVAILVSRQPATKTPGRTVTATAFAGPEFCGVPVAGNTVIFLLDRGNSLRDTFDGLKAACYQTLRQLGPDRKFQVILWDSDSGSAEFPSGAMHNATAGEIEDCQRDFQDITASGSTHLRGPLREALKRKPRTIVIATGKEALDEDDDAEVRGATGDGIQIDSILIDAPTIPTLAAAARATGGEARSISAATLQNYAK